jgi:hypothetical protein
MVEKEEEEKGEKIDGKQERSQTKMKMIIMI